MSRHIADRRERRDDQGHGRHDLVFARIIFPARTHRHRVFADRNRDAKLAAQFVADRRYRVEQIGVFARMSGSGHPVGRQADLADFADLCGGNIRDGLRDGHASRRRRIGDGERRALAHCHRLTGRTAETG